MTCVSEPQRTSKAKMRIAVVGAGISGNLAARLLSTKHDVHLFEASDRVGGHANTVSIEAFGNRYDIDSGFMVFNDRTYPNFRQLLELLGIESQPSDMSFSVRCDRTGLEYQGSSLNGLFAQRANLVRPTFLRMLADILRFNRVSSKFVADLNSEEVHSSVDQTTLGDFVSSHRLGGEFVDRYLVPMGAAIWSAEPGRFLDFPAEFILKFLHNHGLLQIGDRPQWLTVQGRSENYVTKLLRPLRDSVQTGSPVTAIRRENEQVVVTVKNQAPKEFDAVVLATHADQTLRILGDDASPIERKLLSTFPYQENNAVLHTDTSLLPRSRRAWASWNYLVPEEFQSQVTLTYDVNRLQRLAAPQPICVTLNPTTSIDEKRVLATFDYAHPVFGTDSAAAQQRLPEINGNRNTYFCGAYWGYGFHEDGVNSALQVTKLFGIDLDQLEQCSTAASTKERSRTLVATR